MNWYCKLSVVVRWNGHDSATLAVLSGVRQGGVLSPVLFNLYVNCMLTTLRKRNYGCHIGNLFVGCIMYADDLILLSASVLDLQTMLDCCGEVGRDLAITFNCKKSHCMIIGPSKVATPPPMVLDGAAIQWTDRIKYLGLTLVAGVKFKIDLADARRKFFVSTNTILNKCKYTCDVVKLELMESYCLPILMYGLECLNLNKALIKEINSWWNSVYRKIFSYNKWESVKLLICMMGRLDVHHLINMRRLLFIKRVSECQNSVMRDLFCRYSRGRELFEAQTLYNNKISWSSAKIKALTYVSFQSINQ